MNDESTNDSGERRFGRKLHSRRYEVDAYQEDDQHLRIVGELRDFKPDGLWVHGDTEPLTIHHMHLELVVEVSSLKIVDAVAEMIVHPQRECPDVLPAYGDLIGLSIVRGFTHKVREMYGGPKACTHIAALLNAMAPVAIQGLLSAGEGRPRPDVSGEGGGSRGFELNRNSCHVWADEGPMFALVARGEPVPIPITMRNRLTKLGVEPTDAFPGRRPAAP